MPDCPPEESLRAFFNGLIDKEAEIDAICEHLEQCAICEAIMERFEPSEYERKFREVVLEGETLGQEVQEIFDDQLENADELSKIISINVAPPSGAGQNKKDRFEDIDRIGQGHFFKCVKAFDQWQDDYVAVKIPKPSFFTSDAHYVQFQDDCHAYADLDHPNIVPISDFGCWDDKHWFVSMYWIQAKPIDVWLRDTQAELAETLRLVWRVCSAVQHAHECEVIHRHLDFSNILVTDEAQVWVTDFGFVLDKRYQFDLVEDKKRLSGSLPREFSTLENDVWVDQRSDVFSIGKLLSHCLENSGNPNPAWREELDAIVTKSTRRSRSSRYQTVKELASAIAAIHTELEYFAECGI